MKRINLCSDEAYPVYYVSETPSALYSDEIDVTEQWYEEYKQVSERYWQMQDELGEWLYEARG